jgi:hypothetical protein
MIMLPGLPQHHAAKALPKTAATISTPYQDMIIWPYVCDG